MVASSVLSRFLDTRALGRRRLSQAAPTAGLSKIGSEVWISGNLELRDLTGLEVRLGGSEAQAGRLRDLTGLDLRLQRGSNMELPFLFSWLSGEKGAAHICCRGPCLSKRPNP